MTLFHGTNKTITDGTATGTFFTDNFALALSYMRQKDGNRIYAFTNDEEFINDIFGKDMFGEHFISRCFLPITNLTCLLLVVE